MIIGPDGKEIPPWRYALSEWWRIRKLQFWRRFGEKHVCPERGGRVMFKGDTGVDRWLRIGRDRVCSFCGSMHPADFLAVLPSIDGEKWRLELADGRHKIYVTRPGIRNAGEGAIKFYLWHAPEAEADYAAFVKRFEPALHLCREKFKARWSRPS